MQVSALMRGEMSACELRGAGEGGLRAADQGAADQGAAGRRP